MTGFKTILMAGVAIAALTACSSDRGPGAIGSTNDIIVRNAGEPKAPPPKPLEVPVVTATDAVPTDGVTAAPAPVVEAAATVPSEPPTATTAAPAPVAAASEVVAAPAVTAPAAAPAPTTTSSSIDPVTEVAVANPSPAVPEAVPVVKADAAPMKNIPMTSTETPASVTTPAAAPTAATPVETNAAPATAQPVEPAVPAASAAPSVEMTMATLQSGDKLKVMAVQEELKKVGLYAGKTDGKINTETLNAMIRYQSSQGTLAKAPASVAPAVPTSASPAAQPAPLPPAGQAKPVATTAVAPAPPPAPVAAPVSAPTMPAITAQTPMTDPALIRAVQEKLKAQGLLSSISGAMDSATLNALVKYQTSNGLAPGVLNLDTVKKLGIVQ